MASATLLPDQSVPFSHLFQTSCFPNVSRSCPSTLRWTILQELQKTTVYKPTERKRYLLTPRLYSGSTEDSWKKMEQCLWKRLITHGFFCATKITTFIWRKRSTVPCFVSVYCLVVNFMRCILTGQEPWKHLSWFTVPVR